MKMGEDEILCHSITEAIIGDKATLDYYFTVNQIPIRAVIYNESEDAVMGRVNYDELMKEACTYIYFHFMTGRIGQ